MIIRTEEDALLFIEQEGTCGNGVSGFCSPHCELAGGHVAATSSEMGAPFAYTTHPLAVHTARLQRRAEREERAA